MHESKLDKLRDRFDNSDMAKEFENAQVDTKTTSAVMVSTSVSLPQSVVDKVRAKAAKQGISPATLMQKWITDGGLGDGAAAFFFSRCHRCHRLPGSSAATGPYFRAGWSSRGNCGLRQ